MVLEQSTCSNFRDPGEMSFLQMIQTPTTAI